MLQPMLALNIFFIFLVFFVLTCVIYHSKQIDESFRKSKPDKKTENEKLTVEMVTSVCNGSECFKQLGKCINTKWVIPQKTYFRKTTYIIETN